MTKKQEEKLSLANAFRPVKDFYQGKYKDLLCCTCLYARAMMLFVYQGF